MRAPFVRPFFANFFYVFAGLSGAFAIIIGLLIVVGGISLLGRSFAGMVAVNGVFLLISMLIAAGFYAAIGYCIELLAKIEWNTQPPTDSVGYSAEPSPSPAFTVGKQYFLSDRGLVKGPFTAADMLNLYRDGKVTNTTQLLVEENGQRRTLRNWSEIGL